MSGHSKWSQIKRQKGANDAKRGALFTKLTREIITAARQGGGDVEGNYRLRMAIDKARSNSMPAENIKRAIERATGAGADAEQYEEIVYEGLGPSNVAVIVATMTDNRNRTASEIRSIFSKSGGSLTPVSWQFEQRGIISIPLNGRDPDEVTFTAIDAGAADIGSPEAGAILVTTEPGDLERVRAAMAAAGFEADSAELSMEPTTRVEIADEKGARGVLTFVERLEDLDDVQNVYANFDIPDALMEQLGSLGRLIVNREEAGTVAAGVIVRLRQMSYDSLVQRLLGEVEVEEIVGASGVTYQAEIHAMWDGGKPPALLVMVSVDDGGFRSSFSPVTRSFITTGAGAPIGE